MEAEICPNCEKVVYDAEGFPAGGVKNRLLLNFSLDQLENINYQLQELYARKKLLHIISPTYFLLLTKFPSIC